MVKYYVKSFTREDGNRVKGHWVERKSSGMSRGRKSPSAKYSVSKGYKPWITREGKLGGRGFISKSPSSQHKLLISCVKKYGYRSCLGSLMVLNRNKTIKQRHGAVLDDLKSYLKRKYGGRGSFSSRSPKRRSCYDPFQLSF